MVSHPELGSDQPIGSDRESGCDTPPWPWGHGQAKRCSRKRGMGSTTCWLPTIGHKQRTSARKAMHEHAQGNARSHARQLTRVHKAVHR